MGEEEVGVAVVEEALRRRDFVDDEGRHVGAAEECGRVDAVLAEAAAGADVEEGDGDVGEVVVEEDVGGLARGGVGVGQLAIRLQRCGGLLEREEIRLIRVEQARGLAVGAEQAAGEVVEGRRLGSALQQERRLADEEAGVAIGVVAEVNGGPLRIEEPSGSKSASAPRAEMRLPVGLAIWPAAMAALVPCSRAQAKAWSCGTSVFR